MRISRRQLLQSGAILAATPCSASDRHGGAERRRAAAALAASAARLSFFGDLKYPPEFKRFDYVNPDAPKAGLGPTDVDRHLRQLQSGERA